MAASWKGALSFSGFPVNVALHTRTKSRSSDSFKTLAPNGQPIKQQLIDTDGNVVARDQTSKGFERSKGDYVALSDEQVERIESGQRSKVVDPVGFVPVDTIPLALAIGSYVVAPDEKQPGSEKSVNTLWAGLRKTGTAYVTTIKLRQRDSILAVWAENDGLYAATLPFASEIAQVPKPEPVENETEAAMVATIINGMGIAPFDHGAFASEYTTKRAQVIDEVLTGAPAPEATPTADTTATVDLMAALTAAQAELTDKVTAKAVTA